ncbi:hypothetical protein ACLMJK_000121 [Lecanora helva]
METLKAILLEDDDFRREVCAQSPLVRHDAHVVGDKDTLRSNILQAVTAQKQLLQTIEDRRDLETRRKKRSLFLRGAHKTQILAASIIEFLENFSTIADIAKGIDQRAGGVAYGTLYILFKTHEDLITTALKKFSALLHQLVVYRNAHLREERMLNYISEVYTEIVRFARRASIYYAKCSAGNWLPFLWDARIGRWWEAIVKPPKIEVEKQIHAVQTATEQVLAEADAILSKRVEETNKNMTYLHNDSLATLRENLQIDNALSSPASVIEACSTVYSPGLFGSTSRRGRTYVLQECDRHLLSASGLLEPFQSLQKSSLLLMSGINHQFFPYYNTLCWLSPVTVDLARSARGSLAFYSTQYAGGTDSLSSRHTLPTLFNSIIYQLLTWNEDFSRQWRGTVERAVAAETWKTDLMSAQKNLLLVLLNAWADRNDDVSEAPTTIIIDRPDAFCIESTADGTRKWPIVDELLDVVETLLEIVTEAKVVVKVLVVMNTASSEGFRAQTWEWDRLEKQWGQTLLSKRKWEQETIN